MSNCKNRRYEQKIALLAGFAGSGCAASEGKGADQKLWPKQSAREASAPEAPEKEGGEEDPGEG